MLLNYIRALGFLRATFEEKDLKRQEGRRAAGGQSWSQVVAANKNYNKNSFVPINTLRDPWIFSFKHDRHVETGKSSVSEETFRFD